jgi:hypothetical protein
MHRTPLLGRLGRDFHVICCSFSALELESSKWIGGKKKRRREAQVPVKRDQKWAEVSTLI